MNAKPSCKYKPLPGAQIRYLVFHDAYLHRIVNNARFLILPWAEGRNLAS